MPDSDLPDGWRSVPLSAATRLSKQKWEPGDEAEDRQYLSLEHIEAHTGRLLGHGSSDDVKSAKNVFAAGDVLYGKLRPYLSKVARPESPGVCSTDILVFKPTDDLDHGYLSALLQSHAVTTHAMDHAKGINLPRVSPKALGTFRTPLPPLPEQRRIVARLDAIEAHRRAAAEKLDRLPDLLGRYRQSVLAAAFRGDLTAAWREAHPEPEPADSAVRSLYRQRWIENRAQALTDRAEARDAKKGKAWTDATRTQRFKTETAKAEKSFALPDPVQAEDHPRLPEGWSWMTLEEIVDPARGLCYGVVQPGKDPGDGVPLIRVQDLLGEHIDRESLRRIEPAVNDQYERSRVEAGDVLVSLVGTIGRVATVDTEVGYANIARAVGRVAALAGLGRWVALCLQAPQLQEWLQRESREVARKTLNLGTLSQAAIPVPPLAEAAHAAAHATAYLQRGQAIEQATRKASERVEKLRQATLASAFRGELVPTDAALARQSGRPTPAASGKGGGETQTALDL